MRVANIIILCLAMVPLIAQAQQTTAGRWAITVTPALIPMPSGGQLGVQPGFEFRFRDRFSWLNEVTFQTGKKQHVDSAALNKRYFRVKSEVRYHLLGNSQNMLASRDPIHLEVFEMKMKDSIMMICLMIRFIILIKQRSIALLQPFLSNLDLSFQMEKDSPRICL